MHFRDHVVKTVHLEQSSKCNASCPQCNRNILGGKENPNLPLEELYLDDIKQIFDTSFLSKLNRLYMCGNYGDPIVARDTIEIFDYLKSSNPRMTLGMHTNGSARTTDWWKDLGKILDKRTGYVRFGLDGLEDTNHIYRRGTIWNKIIDNVEAFVSAGGNAEWDYIVFRHNEHQVEEARELSKKMGFTKFNVKKTARFFSNLQMKGHEVHNVYDKDGKIEYVLEKPSDEKHQNTSLQKEKSIIEKHGSMEIYLDSTCINCKVIQDKSIYVTAGGYVFPCCWLANDMYLWYKEPFSMPIWKAIEDSGGLDAIDGRKHDIIDIVRGPFFRNIEEGWQKDMANGRQKMCAKICGTEFDPFKSQFEKNS